MALLITYPADKNPFRVVVAGAYARVTGYDGDKSTVTLKLAVWLNQESASLDAEPIGRDDYTFTIPERLDVNPVAWAYDTLKKSGQLGETTDA